MEKIKQIITTSIESRKGKNVLIVIIIILVGSSSFEIGRLSKANSSSGIKIEYPTQNQEVNPISEVESINNIAQNSVQKITKNKVSETFFASNRGHKYYPSGCSAGKSLKQENRIYFATREEAEKAGYELSSSCR